MRAQQKSIRCYLLVLLAVLLGFSGCAQEEVLDNLSQKESLKAMVALYKAGIDAERINQSRGRTEKYKIEVSSEDARRAQELLDELGFPRENDNDAEAITRPQGFVPATPALAGMRLDLALSSQIERSLQALPGVVEAKVMVRSNYTGNVGSKWSSGPFAETKRVSGEGKSQELNTATASVVIRYVSPTEIAPIEVLEVKRMIVGSVPGLALENVLINISRVQLPGSMPMLGVEPGEEGTVVPLARLYPLDIHVPASQKKTAKYKLSLVLIIAICAAGIIGLYLGYEWQKRRNAKLLKRIISERTAQRSNLYVGEAPNSDSAKLVSLPGVDGS